MPGPAAAAPGRTRAWAFLETVPEHERMFLGTAVRDPAVVHDWCTHIDYGHNLPLLAWADRRIIGEAGLHQQLGGWKRHTAASAGALEYRAWAGRGAGVGNRDRPPTRLGQVEAEFTAEQERALRVFGMVGFTPLARLPDYVKDMHAITHDYVDGPRPGHGRGIRRRGLKGLACPLPIVSLSRNDLAGKPAGHANHTD